MNTVGNILDGGSGDIWSVRPEQSVLDAIRLMAEKSIGAVLVIDKGHLAGIFSERDYARKIILEDRETAATKVSEVMTKKPVSVTRAAGVTECMKMMTDKRFRHLPVVEDGKVVGMISIGDLVKAVIAEQQYTIDQLEHYIAG